MEVFNILIESAENLKQKAKEIEKRNIISLEKTNSEIKALLAKASKRRVRKVIHIHDSSENKYESNLPVDYRIIKG